MQMCFKISQAMLYHLNIKVEIRNASISVAFSWIWFTIAQGLVFWFNIPLQIIIIVNKAMWNDEEVFLPDLGREILFSRE